MRAQDHHFSYTKSIESKDEIRRTHEMTIHGVIFSFEIRAYTVQIQEEAYMHRFRWGGRYPAQTEDNRGRQWARWGCNDFFLVASVTDTGPSLRPGAN